MRGCEDGSASTHPGPPRASADHHGSVCPEAGSPRSSLPTPSLVPRFSPADLLLLLVVLVWGIDFSVLKSPLAVMHPHVANALRFVVSASVLRGVYGLRCWERGTSFFFRPIRADWQAVIPLGLLGVGAVPASLMVGLNHTTAGSAALIMVTNPLWTAVLSFLYWPTRV